MFETAEVGASLTKKQYKDEVPKLRKQLLDAQRRLAASDHSTVIVIGGVEGAGKDEVIDTLLAWMDSRGIETHTMWDPSDEERERPRWWKFWRRLPMHGNMAVFFGSWYTLPIVHRALGEIDDVQFEQDLRSIREFERMLAAENVIVIKFWLHVAKDKLQQRIKAIQGDELLRWRSQQKRFEFVDQYDQFRDVSAHCIRETSIGEAPWHIVEATDARYRDITVCSTVANTIENVLTRAEQRVEAPIVPDRPVPADLNVIRQLNQDQIIERADYKKKLKKKQAKLAKLSQQLRQSRKSLILVFEGPDAAGKGGAIRRVTAAMDARNYRVNAVAAPTDEEAARPYLWRFWRHLPRQGKVTIYDRSWYGRVLVERIEGFCAPEDWQRAYSEINEFEDQLTRAGTLVLKFWIAITPEEQLERFRDRQQTPYKHYKLTEEDWRNREKWDAYEAAACDMVERTSTDDAPWILVAGDHKRHARLQVLREVTKRLKKHLKS